MIFEKVYSLRDFYDGVRSGTADFGGVPHYFTALPETDDGADDHVTQFRLYPVSAPFMERELRHWSIFRAWQAKHHSGLAPLEIHPGHGGVDAEYDELSRWLDEQISILRPIELLHTATFRAIPGQDQLPHGISRELEVAWSLAPTS